MRTVIPLAKCIFPSDFPSRAMGRRTVFFVMAFFALSCSSLLFAQRTLVLATDVWPPYRIAAEGGGLKGIDIDIIRAIEKKSGITIVIEQHPWARSLEMLRSGEVDLMCGLAWSAERELYIHFLSPAYHRVQPVFYARRDSGIQVSRYDDLAGKRIGQSSSTVYFEPFNSDISLVKITLPSEPQILQMLSLRRIDLAVGTEPNISWDIKRLGYAGLFVRVDYVPPVRTNLYFGMSKESDAMNAIPAIERALRELVEDGTIERIEEEYR